MPRDVVVLFFSTHYELIDIRIALPPSASEIPRCATSVVLLFVMLFVAVAVRFVFVCVRGFGHVSGVCGLPHRHPNTIGT